jgi:catechol 2,3-dioxygenase-like lactoylglutathione lyase family enzyme
MRLNQVTVTTSDMPAAIAFYELLGLRLIVLSPHYARFEMPDGEATFSVHFSVGDAARENAPTVYFECDDLDEEVARLRRVDVAIEGPKNQTWLWREAWLRDPAGNAVCLYKAGDMRRHPPWRLPDQPGPQNLHIVLLDDGMLLVKRDDPNWRALQDEFPTFKASLGPYDLFDVLSELQHEWPSIYAERGAAVRAFIHEPGDTLVL